MPNCLERISTCAVDKAAKELRNLRDAKATHREKWLQRLRDAAVRWEQQLKQHTDQQSKCNYASLAKKVKLELKAARHTLSTLNQKAADVYGDLAEVAEALPDQEDSHNDAEAQELAQQVHTILQSCAKAAGKTELMEVSEVSDEEEPQGGPAKRQRSLEPFGRTVKS